MSESNSVTVTERGFVQEFFFTPAQQSNTDLLSLGRNGVMQTVGINTRALGSWFGIQPINSRQKVGRAEIRIPYDKEHLTALKNVIERELQKIESESSS